MSIRGRILAALLAMLVVTGCARRDYSKALDTTNLGGNTAVLVGYVASLPEVQEVIGRYQSHEIAGISEMSSGVPLLRDFRGDNERHSMQIKLKGTRAEAIMLAAVESNENAPAKVTSVQVFSREAYDTWFIALPPPVDEDQLHEAAVAEAVNNSAVRKHAGIPKKITWIEYPLAPPTILNDLQSMKSDEVSEAVDKYQAEKMVTRTVTVEPSGTAGLATPASIVQVVADPLPSPGKPGAGLLSSMISSKHADTRNVNLRIEGSEGSCLLFGTARHGADGWKITARGTAADLPESADAEFPPAARPQIQIIYEAP